MRVFALVALIPFALALVERQAAPPACAVGCLADVSLNPAPCGGTDFVCLCTNAEIQGKVATCVASSCASDQIPIATTFLQETCRAAGAPVPEVPSALQSASGAASSAVASASSVAASVSSAISSVSASASSAIATSASVTSASAASSSGAVASVSSALASSSSKAGAKATGVAKSFVALGLGVAGALMM